MESPGLHSVMNNTKWEELRLAMGAIAPSPQWRCKSVAGYYSDPDREWRYHFKANGYEDIQYVDIFADGPNHREQIKFALAKIHLPGEEIDDGFRVYGYARTGQILDYL